MERDHGLDHAEKKRRIRQEAKLLRSSQEGAVLTARTLFSTRSVGSTGSSRTAADASTLLNRAGLLLPNKECYADFVEKMEGVIDLGEACYAGTFTPEFVRKIRCRTKILFDVYTAFDLDRDRQELAGSVAEHFFLRFRGDTDRGVMSPQSGLEWDCYLELFNILEVESEVIVAKLQKKRTAAALEPGSSPGQPPLPGPGGLPAGGVPTTFGPTVGGPPLQEAQAEQEQDSQQPF